MAKKEKRFTKPEWSWIFYDWANSIYATNIMAAIFPILYSQVAGKGTVGDHVYGYAVSFANLLVAVLAPYLGAIADFRGMKKKLWFAFMITGVVFTAVMGVVRLYDHGRGLYGGDGRRRQLEADAHRLHPQPDRFQRLLYVL